MNNHTTLHIDCQADDKAAWFRSARVAGLPFEDWVRLSLNAAAIETNPDWLQGLSERTRVCLLSAGFNSRDSVLQAIAHGLDISTISNAGNRVKTEVEAWLKND